ncbi:MAG TPA: diaminopropionate ammonia-lyase [Gemmatimonadales bacterium]|nr:diaminopropionate ammonia-lyase [Gemmatimonadales bacterium]
MHHLVTTTTTPPRIGRLADLADEAQAFHRSMPGYSITPLHRLDSLAHSIGAGSLLLKDESYRFGLNAFKGLGASFAVHKWLTTHPASGDVTFTTATDGNHGRSVAWAARMAGHRAVVFIPSHAAPSRVAAIREQGAEVHLVAEGYDAAVRRAEATAAREGWVLVQDFAHDGYTEIPDWIMAGYWTHARELEPVPHGADRPDIDLVILHAGVGTWPAAIAAYYWHRYGAARPRIAIVEPSRAACVLAGIRAGKPVMIDSPERTVMAGLDCATASTTALEILSAGADAFFAIDEAWVLEAMRRLASPMGSDPVVIAGESGAASVAGLLALHGEPALAPVREHLGLGPASRVLVWSTEGATDPVHWAKVVGRPVPA